MADLEKAVPVGGPIDLVEQAVLDVAVVAPRDHVGLLPRADVPLPGRDHGGRVGVEAEHAEPQDARREDVGAVDHDGDGLAVRGSEAAVHGGRRRGSGFGAEVQVPELCSEAADEVLAEALIAVRAILDDDHLVVEVVDALLVAPRQGVQGPSRLAAHVVDHDDHGQVLRRGGRPVRGGAVGRSRVVRLPPRRGAPVHTLERLGDPVLRAERVNRGLAIRVAVVVDHHEPSGRDPFVGGVEHRPDLVGVVAVDAKQRQRPGPRVGQCFRGRSLEECHTLVEQIEVREHVPHRVQVGWERPAAVGAGVAASVEAIGQPDPGAGQLVGLQEAAHEDRGAPAADAAVHEVAGDAVLANGVEDVLQVVQAPAAEAGVGKRFGSARRVGVTRWMLAAQPFEAQPAERHRHVAGRVCEHAGVGGLAGADTLHEVFDPQLVFDVVLVEQRPLQEVEVAAGGACRLSFGRPGHAVLLAGHLGTSARTER